MPAPSCYQSMQACYLRAVLLDTDGSVLDGDDSVYTTDSLISIDNAFTIATGDSFEVKNGCGAICATYEDDDRIKGTTGTTTLCQLDSQLLTMMTGATLLTDLSGDPIGLEVPGSNAPARTGVALEVWSKAWDGDERAVDGADELWFRHYWPKVRGTLGGWTIENAVLLAQVTLKGSANSVLGAAHGPAGDWPSQAVGNPYGFFLDTTHPEVLCEPTPAPLIS